MNPDSEGDDRGEAFFPTAMIQKGSSTALRMLRVHWRLFGWVVILCGVVAATLVASGMMQTGTVIQIRFERGEGLKPGDTLRYRGVAIGEVVGIVLEPGLQGISVRIRLDRRAEGMACEGSIFWVERPLVTLGRMRGLETLAGSKYVGAIPGPDPAKRRTGFEGLTRPPVFTDTAKGVAIAVHFSSGHGLQVGDLVRYRGLVVGEVTSVEIDSARDGVRIGAWLAERAQFLARAGTRFWVERPRMNLGDIYGLETVFGGRYLTAIPGPEGAEEVSEFEGLDVPAQTIQRKPGGIEVVLSSPNKRGLEPGSPVTYRGIVVGRILAVQLANDAVRVDARAYVEPEFARLVRENTRFWNSSGVDFSLGWKGVRVDMHSLKTVVSGGVSIAVPGDAGRQVVTGHRFVVHDRPEEEWRKWSDPVALGSVLLPAGATSPEPVRATSWLPGRGRSRRERGWVVVLEGGRLLGPARLLVPEGPEGKEGTPERQLALGGRVLVLSRGRLHVLGEVAVYESSENLDEVRAAWPLSRLRRATDPEDCLLVSDPLLPERALAAERMQRADDGWVVDTSIPFTADNSGAVLVSRSDGRIVGMLAVSKKGKARVALLPAELPGLLEQ